MFPRAALIPAPPVNPLNPILKLEPPVKKAAPIKTAPNKIFPKPLPEPVITGIKCISSFPMG